MNNSQRVIYNTIFLYANMIVNIFVQLFAIRLTLNALGETDYGIFNILAGLVTLFSFMNAAMAAASQRFLSYEIGKKGNVKEIFYISLILHLAIGFIVVILLETGGIYYVENILIAPAERISTAKIVLHCIIASTFVNIITVPYEAAINANENMGAIVSINILESLMKLAIAIYIGYTSMDRLFIYGLLTMATIIIILIIKRIYCLRHYEEAHFKWHKVKDLAKMKEMASFAAWNFIGAGCSVARFQGTAMILNYFFGIITNAAYGVAQHVNGLITFLAATILRSIRPQIVKSAGAQDYSRMHRLSATTCKITSLMVALVSVPIFVEMPFLLHIWLGAGATAECAIFCRCFLVIVFINQLTAGLNITVESVGKIRMMQTILGSMHIIALPAGFICFSLNLPAISIMLCIIAEEVLGLFVRTIIAHKLTNINMKIVLLKNALPCFLIALGALLTCTFISKNIENEWLDALTITLFSTLFICS
ncbi:MAG: hypothetical protein K6E54_05455, partial [Bacteroidaceae bacterium]|nr:hypothetical protein [Bacteroidaceae bacterium]